MSVTPMSKETTQSAVMLSENEIFAAHERESIFRLPVVVALPVLKVMTGAG